MTHIRLKIALDDADSVYLDVTRDEEYFAVFVGRWMVEAVGGDLIVREPNRPVNETPLLRVPCDRPNPEPIA